MLSLEKACVDDAQEIHDLKKQSFSELLNKYHDNVYSPAAEELVKTVNKLLEATTDYYFITLDNEHIGAIRIGNLGELCQLKQLFILPKNQGHGYAQSVISIAEVLNTGNWIQSCKKISYAIYMKKWDILKMEKLNTLKRAWI